MFPKIKRKGISNESNGNDAGDADDAAAAAESSDYVFRIISKAPQEHSGNSSIHPIRKANAMENVQVGYKT